MKDIFNTPIEFLKGVGSIRSELFSKELKIYTLGDLIVHYPFRYEDRTSIYQIKEIKGIEENVQLKGKFKNFKTHGIGRKMRLTAEFYDQSGVIEVIWFKGVNWILNKLKSETTFSIFGKPTVFNTKISIAHPEIEYEPGDPSEFKALTPIYSTTEKLKSKYIDSRAIAKIIAQQLPQIQYNVGEILPSEIIQKYKLCSRAEALRMIHRPRNHEELHQARRRLKFEELFFIQLKILKNKVESKHRFPGQVFLKLDKLYAFYNEHLPFELTDAQKKVIKEIHNDFVSGFQMNRLLQGDVGSGKTMVAFLCMLIAKDNDAQSCLMAPTEILAEQHFIGLSEYADQLNIKIAKLSGSTKTAKRKLILECLALGEIDIIIGTHALLEDRVQFKNLGLCVIDEQHRFGVAQRAKLWQKNKSNYPHILVMTATPIPRTLAMTFYGDLEVSVIDELPPGRKPIQTRHAKDAHRLEIFHFLKEQIKLGRQIYIVYPLIEESKKLDYKDLMDGYESIQRSFEGTPISILHGRMKPDAKTYEMERFVKGETKILVSTTVIEVGVNVPNASVMVIENAEKFGLAQLHQLRGRVGRGADQSYCILVSGKKVSKDAKIRLDTMVRSQDGFEIAEVDLKIRGPGDLTGTQQSGVLEMKIASLSQDASILTEARETVKEILKLDPELSSKDNIGLKRYLQSQNNEKLNWKMIS